MANGVIVIGTRSLASAPTVKTLCVIDEDRRVVVRRVLAVADVQAATEPAAYRIDAEQTFESPARMIRVVEIRGRHRRSGRHAEIQTAICRRRGIGME